MEGRKLAYLKNQKNNNLTSAWNITLDFDDLYQHLSRDDEDIIKRDN